jgi:hypothetical protein
MAYSPAVGFLVVARWSFVVSCILLLVSGHSTYSDARDKFNDTLLIVKYNYNVTAASAHDHLRMWRQVFPNQMIYVPWNAEQISHAKGFLLGHTTAQFISRLNDTEGYYAYTVAVDAMIKYPNYGRYLFAHDDMAMNMSKLMEIDRKLSVFADGGEYGTYEWKAPGKHGKYNEYFTLFFYILLSIFGLCPLDYSHFLTFMLGLY